VVVYTQVRSADTQAAQQQRHHEPRYGAGHAGHQHEAKDRVWRARRQQRLEHDREHDGARVGWHAVAPDANYHVLRIGLALRERATSDVSDTATVGRRVETRATYSHESLGRGREHELVGIEQLAPGREVRLGLGGAQLRAAVSLSYLCIAGELERKGRCVLLGRERVMVSACARLRACWRVPVRRTKAGCEMRTS